MPAVQTVGASPKKIAATITAYLATLACGFVAKRLGWNIDVTTAQALLSPLVVAAVTYVAAHLAPPGKVYVDQTLYPDAFTGPNPPARLKTVPEPEKPKRTRKKAS
jgi:hypothetical protein